MYGSVFFLVFDTFFNEKLGFLKFFKVTQECKVLVVLYPNVIYLLFWYHLHTGNIRKQHTQHKKNVETLSKSRLIPCDSD